ncbi:MAG: outer rane efflux protein [Sphingobacteriales bacterium]|nr:outer rane efflux protein [Sphingobacteriales bacterium]
MNYCLHLNKSIKPKMKLRSFILPLLFISLITKSAYSQERLSLQQAVEISLQNNFDIKLSSNNVDIAKTNVSRGLSAMLPTVTGNFTRSNAIQNLEQTRSGTTEKKDWAKSSNMAYGPVLNWQIFDGFGMFARYDQLKEFQKLGETTLQLTIQNTLTNVITNYYDLVQQQQQIRALQTALEISRIRLKNSRSRYEIGKAAKLEVLAASVDLNTDTTNLLRQRDTYRNTKIKLNELLSRSIDTDFTVADTIIIQNNLKLTELQNIASTQNPAIQSAIINQRIADLNLKQIRSDRYPVISLNSGYNFNKSTSELGFANLSQSNGLNYGVSASLNIFSGFLQRKNERIASIEVMNSTLQLEKTNLNITSQIASFYQTYQTNLELVNLEEQNLNVAKQNLDITLEKFRLGSVAPLEFREAQRNYIDASARYSNAQFEAKLAEISLKQLTGSIKL